MTVEMQWRMLQQPEFQRTVAATGRQQSVRRFIELTALELGGEKSSGGVKACMEVAFVVQVR